MWFWSKQWVTHVSKTVSCANVTAPVLCSDRDCRSKGPCRDCPLQCQGSNMRPRQQIIRGVRERFAKVVFLFAKNGRLQIKEFRSTAMWNLSIPLLCCIGTRLGNHSQLGYGHGYVYGPLRQCRMAHSPQPDIYKGATLRLQTTEHHESWNILNLYWSSQFVNHCKSIFCLHVLVKKNICIHNLFIVKHIWRN